MKTQIAALTLCLGLLTPAIVLNSANEAKAQNNGRCQVTDPTGTPLNVRSSPNGRVINQLRNGKNVQILAVSSDAKGRSWARIGGYHNGVYREWGWVYREFISCY
jgi:Bacterial SH3 domain